MQKLLYLDSRIKKQLFSTRLKGFNIDEILLSSLFLTISEVFGIQNLLINHEGHGRNSLESVDVSRTMGWFTSIYPVAIEMLPTIRETVEKISATLRKIRSIDINYGIANFSAKKRPDLKNLKPSVLFNYFGRVGPDLMNHSKALLSDCEQLTISTSHPENTVPHSLEVNAIATEEHVRISFMYDSKSYTQETMEQFFEKFPKKVELILDHCTHERTLP